MEKTELEKYIVSQIRDRRIKRGLSGEKLSLRLGMNNGFIGDNEAPSKSAKYNIFHLNEIARILECSPKDFWPDKPFEGIGIPAEKQEENLSTTIRALIVIEFFNDWVGTSEVRKKIKADSSNIVDSSRISALLIQLSKEGILEIQKKKGKNLYRRL